MRRLLKMRMSAVLVLVLMLAGCGGSSSKSQSSSTPTSAGQTTPTTTTGTQTSGAATASTSNDAQTAKAGAAKHVPTEAIQVSSPVFRGGSVIPARYTCDGAGTSPPLRWSAIPRGTVELVLFIVDTKSTSAGKPQIYWAVAGLHPTLKGLSAGRLPPGAIVGRNSLGQSRYTICPAKSRGLQQYAVALLAMPHSVSATPGFSAKALFKAVLRTAEYSGLAAFAYKRR